jgi:V-type H+-transporting ATPase subunit E
VSTDKKKYKNLLRDLLAQALCRMLEPEVDVRVRKEDVSIIKDALKEARDTYEKETGMQCKVHVKEDRFLPDSW